MGRGKFVGISDAARSGGKGLPYLRGADEADAAVKSAEGAVLQRAMVVFAGVITTTAAAAALVVLFVVVFVILAFVGPGVG